MTEDDLFSLSKNVINVLREKGAALVTVESCTGGMIAAALTEVPGSSAVIEGSLVTYSNTLKQKLVNVRAETLQTYGAVSEETAREMADGALDNLPTATVSIAVTGIAGPDGGSPKKPVGTVCFALAYRGHKTQSQRLLFSGDRHAIRSASTSHALRMLQAL